MSKLENLNFTGWYLDGSCQLSLGDHTMCRNFLPLANFWLFKIVFINKVIDIFKNDCIIQ